MKNTDPVYGEIEINEPVLLALLQTPSLLRLQGVLQAGITALIGIRHPTTRFEHSLGVAWLVRCLGGSLEEQIAALLHDVSHTAFSHVIDFVFNAHQGQAVHEDKKEEFIEKSEIPKVLRQFGYDWHDFLNEQGFSLLEQPAPALCADRLDYFLRDSLTLNILTPQVIGETLEHLVVHDGRIAVDDIFVASRLGYAYIHADQASWANLREVGIYELTARAIRYALESGQLSDADLWTDDEQVWFKMHDSDDKELKSLLGLISSKTQFVWDELYPTFWVSPKVRSIDPDIVIDGKMVPLSQLDREFRRDRDNYLRSKVGSWPVRVIA
jgi:HD superfamily phosphohydrolase